jgi:PAS domain S-box-containing protein
MSWITFIWSVTAGICLALAALHLMVWVRSRDSWVYLLFAIAAAAAAGSSVIELAMMHAQTPEQYGEAMRWLHLPVFLMVVSLVWFIRLYLKAGRLWLAWLICGLRAVTLVLTFSLDPNLNFSKISGLNRFFAWGETVVTAIGEKNPWANITHFSALLFLLFVLDAAFVAWRQGHRQRAMIVGGTFACAIVVALVESEMLNRGILPVPFTVGIVFLIIVLGISYQLSLDLLRSNQLARELEGSLERIRLASTGTNLGIWEWDVDRDDFWLNETSRARIGVGESDRITFNRFLESLHPDDREPTRQFVNQMLEGGRNFEWEYRAPTSDGSIRLISTWGQVERSVGGKPLLVRGVSMDITERKQAESERIQLRSELAHLGRVMTMSELSAYLAHEINQPLGAILNNASAARTLNSKLKEGSAEFGEILADIIADATRAGEIIRKVRGIMIKGEAKFELLNLNILIERVVELYRNMLNIEKTLVSLDLQPDLSPIRGDRIQLQQVLMNLVSNAIENMKQSFPKKLSILSTMQSPDMITVSVSDSGTGVDEANKDKVFQPFFTTKKDGMGMGLRICQSIIEEHSGRIWVENNPAGGATFSFSLISHQGDSK